MLLSFKFRRQAHPYDGGWWGGFRIYRITGRPLPYIGMGIGDVFVVSKDVALHVALDGCSVRADSTDIGLFSSVNSTVLRQMKTGRERLATNGTNPVFARTWTPSMDGDAVV